MFDLVDCFILRYIYIFFMTIIIIIIIVIIIINNNNNNNNIWKRRRKKKSRNVPLAYRKLKYCVFILFF